MLYEQTVETAKLQGVKLEKISGKVVEGVVCHFKALHLSETNYFYSYNHIYGYLERIKNETLSSGV